MKTKLRISHSVHPDGTVLYPCKESKEKNIIPTVAVLIILLTYVLIIGSLLFINLLNK